MVGLGEAMLDAVASADSVEGMAAPHGGGPGPVLGQISKLDAVVDKHGANFVEDGFDQFV